MLVRYGIPFCAHLINDLPFEEKEQMAANAKLMNETGTSQVKCHSLYILEGTKLGEMYKKGEITMLKDSDFIDRTILFLRNLSPDTVIQRLMGRAPKDRTLFCNYGRSWRSIVDEMTKFMIENSLSQGDLLKTGDTL
jgi:radical SAM superfamily enzyme